MADDGKKIVTKKTPVKAAGAPSGTTANATQFKKTAAKKAAPKATPAGAAKPAPAARLPAVPTAAAKAMPAAAPPATSRTKTAPARSTAKPAAATAPAKRAVDAETRLAMIHEAAYYKAEARNFAPGFEAQDWADAEREVDASLGNAG